MNMHENSFAQDFAKAGIKPEVLAEEFGQSVRQIKRYIAGECSVPIGG